MKSALTAAAGAGAGARLAAASGFAAAPPDGAGLEVAELDWLNSGLGSGQVHERGRGSGSKSGSISTTWGASAMVTPAPPPAAENAGGESERGGERAPRAGRGLAAEVSAASGRKPGARRGAMKSELRT